MYIQPITARVSQIQGDTTAGQSDSEKAEATGVAVILAAGCVAFGVLSTPVLALAVCRLSHTMKLGGGTEYPPTPEQKTTPLVPRHMAQTHRCWTVEDQRAAAILHAAIDMDQPGQERDPGLYPKISDSKQVDQLWENPTPMSASDPGMSSEDDSSQSDTAHLDKQWAPDYFMGGWGYPRHLMTLCHKELPQIQEEHTGTDLTSLDLWTDSVEDITSENDSEYPEDGSHKSEDGAVAARHKMGPVAGSPPRQDHLTDQAIVHSTQGLKLQKQRRKKYRRYTSPYGHYDQDSMSPLQHHKHVGRFCGRLVAKPGRCLFQYAGIAYPPRRSQRDRPPPNCCHT